MRDKHDTGIKQMCSSGISFGRSKLLQSCSNLTLKPELEPAVTACLAGRDAQEVLYTGFVQTPSGNSRWLRFLPNICNADIHKTAFSAKTLNTATNELLMICKEGAEALVKTIRRAFWQLPIILLSLFGSQRAGHCFWWGRTKILCIHTKPITVCRRLQAVKKERRLVVYVCRVCCGSKNSKNVLFRSIRISLEKSVST